jgi:3-mercaptopyruvate sulfurtransferase SseA
MSTEPLGWTAALALSTSFIAYEGARRADLDERTPLAPRALYQAIGTSAVKLQIVDVRPDPIDNYEDDHVPGAIPFPGCDSTTVDDKIKPFLVPSLPTVIVSQDGDPQVFSTCTAFFTSARNLDGGFDAWEAAGLPTVGDVYVPPKPSAGGGCL